MRKSLWFIWFIWCEFSWGLSYKQGGGGGGGGGCGPLVRFIHMSFYYYSYPKIHGMARSQFTTLLADAWCDAVFEWQNSRLPAILARSVGYFREAAPIRVIQEELSLWLRWCNPTVPLSLNLKLSYDKEREHKLQTSSHDWRKARKQNLKKPKCAHQVKACYGCGCFCFFFC